MSFQNKLFKYESKLNNLQKGGSDLSDAISRNNLDYVRAYFSPPNNNNVNDVVPDNIYGETPIFFADSVEMIQLLIEKGANINAANSYGGTVIGSKFNNEYLILYLIKNGADPVIRIGPEGPLYLMNHYIRKTISRPDNLTLVGYEIFSLLLKDLKIDVHNVEDFVPSNHGRLNKSVKDHIIIPLITCHPEIFDFDFTDEHGTMKFSKYLMRIWNITPADILSYVDSSAQDRRAHAERSFQRERLNLGASVPPLAAPPLAAPPLAAPPLAAPSVPLLAVPKNSFFKQT